MVFGFNDPWNNINFTIWINIQIIGWQIIKYHSN